MAKRVLGTYLEFLESARAIFGNIFEFQGSVWKCVDYGLILQNYRDSVGNMAGIS
jgi:hypothetical protein